MTTLTIIGAGKLGKTLGYLFAKNKSFIIQDVLCRTLAASQVACDFIQAGHPADQYAHLKPADVFLLAVTDDQLPGAVNNLLSTQLINQNTILFHCSGPLSSSLLLPFKKLGASIASIHPIKNFSDPKESIRTFTNTFCAIEGDPKACQILEEKFITIGGKIFNVKQDKKMLYHIACIFSSNYFISLMDVALTLLSESGISRAQGYEILDPIVMGTWENMKTTDTVEALTGPIARGDNDIVNKQLICLETHQPEFAQAYKILGRLALKLVRQKGKLDDETIANLTENLRD